MPNGTPGYWQGAQGYGSQSPYDPQSPYYNPYAMGNRPFFMPAMGGGGQSPVSQGIQQQMGQQYVGGGSWQPLGSAGMPAPGGMGMMGGAGQFGGQDPRYFGQFAAPQALMQTQYGLGETGVASAIERARGLMGGMGIPAEGGLGDLETWAQQRAVLEAEPVRRREQSALRAISDLWARKGSALGSEAERNIAEVRGASLAALRSSVVGAAIDAFMKRPQILAQMIGVSRG